MLSLKQNRQDIIIYKLQNPLFLEIQIIKHYY